MDRIPNADAQRLVDSLINRDIPPTQNEIQQVAALCYRIGKNDGAIEQCDRFLRTKVPA